MQFYGNKTEELLSNLSKVELIELRDKLRGITKHKIQEMAYPKCKVKIERNSGSFISKDIIDLMEHKAGKDRIKDVIEIISIKAEEESRGYGTNALKSFFLGLGGDFEDSVIVLKAEPMFPTKEDYENCSINEYNRKLDKIIDFYEKNGFETINDLVGYESAEAMLYVGNSAGKTVKKLVERQILQFK